MIEFNYPSQNVLRLILKSPRFDQFGANLSPLGANSDLPDAHDMSVFASCGPLLFILVVLMVLIINDVESAVIV